VNAIADAGVSYISEALKVNNTLTKINFYCVNVFLSPFLVFSLNSLLFSPTINREWYWSRWRCADCRSVESEHDIG